MIGEAIFGDYAGQIIFNLVLWLEKVNFEVFKVEMHEKGVILKIFDAFFNQESFKNLLKFFPVLS